MSIRKNLAGVAFVGFAFAATMQTANAAPLTLTLDASYFTVAETGDPDFGTGPCCGSVYSNEVTGTLSANHLPVYNAGYGGPVLNDVNGDGELTWWSPSATVTATAGGTITLPFSGDLFPPSGTGSGDTDGFQTAIFSTTLNFATAETVTFTFNADDDAFLSLDDQVLAQLGGIHAISSGNEQTVTVSLAAGQDYVLRLFFADRYNVASHLNLTADGVPAPAPEPITLSLFGAGLAGLGFARRRKT